MTSDKVNKLNWLPENVDFSQRFQKRLKEIIDALGGPKAAAELAGINRTTLWNWLEGKSRPPLITCALFCERTGYSLDWLGGLVSEKMIKSTDEQSAFGEGGPTAIDTKALTDIISAIGEWSIDADHKLSPDKYARLVVAMYDHLISNADEPANIDEMISQKSALSR